MSDERDFIGKAAGDDGVCTCCPCTDRAEQHVLHRTTAPCWDSHGARVGWGGTEASHPAPNSDPNFSGPTAKN